MQEEKPKPKNRQTDGGAAERYLRVQSDIARQQEKAERGAGRLNTEEAEELAGEIARLLRESARAAEGIEMTGATRQFEVAITQAENRLLISAVRREPVLEENHLPEQSGEML